MCNMAAMNLAWEFARTMGIRAATIRGCEDNTVTTGSH